MRFLLYGLPNQIPDRQTVWKCSPLKRMQKGKTYCIVGPAGGGESCSRSPRGYLTGLDLLLMLSTLSLCTVVKTGRVEQEVAMSDVTI